MTIDVHDHQQRCMSQPRIAAEREQVDAGWRARPRLFAWMIPGEARVFPLAELEQAKTWVAGDAT